MPLTLCITVAWDNTKSSIKTEGVSFMYDPFLHFYPIQSVAFLSRSNSVET